MNSKIKKKIILKTRTTNKRTFIKFLNSWYSYLMKNKDYDDSIIQYSYFKKWSKHYKINLKMLIANIKENRKVK